MIKMTQINVPSEQAERLEVGAKAMGLTIPAYIEFLEQCRLGRLDPAAQSAARFAFSTQAESLRKLAE